MRALFLLPLLVLAPACQERRPDPRGVDRDETLLTVAATGRADARPDEARLQLGVNSLGPSAAEASRANREKMERVAAVLSRLGVKPDQMQTRNMSLQRIDYGADRGRFRAENLIEVRMRAMDRVGEAIAAVTDAGANVVSGPELRVSDREGSSKSAYAAAYRAARSRAEAYAGAAGLKVQRVLAIYDGGEGYAPPPMMRGMAVDAVAQTAAPPPVAAVPFSPGVNTTEVRVRVDFALGE
ncbi:SIMPL domain-containing protein [Sphingomonas sp.]|jgi:hypothetical protein|uniref:SIMPL domain-containing protein n=1 Tax=Sphingomonas sp. TaxID=28214 RepID=UPI002DEF6B11|nr:SIMPL domain-containing protein [Sphingomonas sp.]HEV2567216.1 SIMPL domain-containing protein [Sphingomonas sp.]